MTTGSPQRAQQTTPELAKVQELPAPARAPSVPKPGTIVFPGDGGQDISVTVDRLGIHVKQRGNETVVPIRDIVPRGAVQMTYSVSAALVFSILAIPIGRAIGRWIDRRGTVPQMPVDAGRRLAAMETAIDAVAVEVERIGEGQRYAAKLMAERNQDQVGRG